MSRIDNQLVEDLLQGVGDSISDVIEQMMRGSWRDDHGHFVMDNVAMVNLAGQLRKMMKFRTDNFGYKDVLNGPS